mmetsp:Transcript_36137/g.71043  ORF Transcript_36137/g.71043 Transcript_36137/m.71043 type:complete len:528 (+) Transcript_36137:38-1621(+)
MAKRKKLKLKEKPPKSSKRAIKEEQALEKFLFGSDATEVDSIPFGSELEQVGGEEAKYHDEEAGMFVVDTVGSTGAENNGKKTSDKQNGNSFQLVPAWEDEDDEQEMVNIASDSRLRKLRTTEEEALIHGKEYEQRLRAKHHQLSGAASWAQLPSEGGRTEASDNSDSDDGSAGDETVDMFRSTQGVLEAAPSRLPPTTLQITRMKDANVKDPSKAVVQSVEFHPDGELLMTAGMDKTIRLFQVDGQRNPKVQGVHLKDLPIYQASFSPDGTEVIATGRRKFFYSYDLQAGNVVKVPYVKGREEKSWESFCMSSDGREITLFGNNGYLVQIDRRSKQWVANMKMNGQVRGVCYNKAGTILYTTGDEGQVMLWDVRRRQALAAFADDGCVHGSAIALSQDGQYLATGAESGVVNIYNASTNFADFADAPSSSSSSTVPLKALLNLTTPIDSLHFNHDSQLLVAASRRQKDALKLFHLPTMTTFSNWPTSSTPLHYVSAVALSPRSGFLAIGNARGRVLLYRLNHFAAI